MKAVPLRFVADVRTSSVDKHIHDGELPVQLCNYVDVYRKDVVRPGPDLMRATATPEEIARFRLEQGDTVLTKDSEDPSEMGISAFIDGTADDFVCGYHLAIARPTGAVHAKFLNWAIRSRPVLDHFTQHSSGISRYGLSLSGLRSAPIPYAELGEQRRIADFLDDRVARIDQIITARRAQVSSAAEMVSTAMTHATTPSHVEETDWRLARFNRVARVNDGLVDPGDPSFADMPLVAPNHIEKRTGRLLELVSAREQGAESGKGYVRSGQVIYSKIRPSLRKATIAPMDVLCSADAYGLEVNRDYMTPAFLLATVLGDFFSQQAVEVSDRVAMPKVNRETLAEIVVWVPPLDEQESATLRIQNIQQTADQLGASLNASIALLAEYKQSLITAAVSGELDVATATSRIPR